MSTVAKVSVVEKYGNNIVNKVKSRKVKLEKFEERHGYNHPYSTFLRTQLAKLQEKANCFIGYVHISS